MDTERRTLVVIYSVAVFIRACFLFPLLLTATDVVIDLFRFWAIGAAIRKTLSKKPGFSKHVDAEYENMEERRVFYLLDTAASLVFM